jgi:RimJ/RimL family protein N-acetyltransferase
LVVVASARTPSNLQLAWYAFRTAPASFLGGAVVVVCIECLLLWAVALRAWPPSAARLAATIGLMAAAFTYLAVVGSWVTGERVRRAAIGQLVPSEGLLTERLLLRPAQATDVEALLATADGEAMRANGWSMRTRDSWRRATAIAGCAALHGDIAICERPGGVVGLATVRREDDGDGCQLGWWLGPGKRGIGYGTEVVNALSRHLLAQGWSSVRVGTSVENVAVQRVAMKAGATEVERRPHVLPDGARVESIWYELRGDVA